MSSRYDVFVPLVHRLAALAYALPFLAMLARAGMAVGPDASFINVALFVAVAIAPAVAWMLGVRWCRIVVVLAAIGSLLLWLLVPLAQHRIDRTIGFWATWVAVTGLFLLAAIAALTRTAPNAEKA